MRHRKTRLVAVVGVLLAGALAAILVVPAGRQLGTFEGLWLAAGIFGLPVLAVMAITGWWYYGGLRSVAVAAVVTVISSVLTWVVVVFTVVSALSGSVAGFGLAIVLFGVPALSVVILGLLALRLLQGVERERSEGVESPRR